VLLLVIAQNNAATAVAQHSNPSDYVCFMIYTSDVAAPTPVPCLR
jgi:hypothetical protein